VTAKDEVATVEDEIVRRDAVPAQAGSADMDELDEFEDQEPVEEWPPREWRETTRSAGHRQAAWVTLAMLAMFGVLVFVAIWGSHNG
jgi:hypothetical protein